MNRNEIFTKSKEAVKGAVDDTKNCLVESAKEIQYECVPSKDSFTAENLHKNFSWIRDVIHVPYSPALTRPGWLVKLVTGPKDIQFWEGVYGDLFAGFTVGFTVIPQALSYAALAGLPPINGLYSVILPSVIYIIFGSACNLAVGPVALASLLTGELVTKYGIDSSTDPVLAVNFAAEASFCVGLLLFLMGLFNLGNLIRFISYPVMTGFTTASAMIIGMQQIKNAFGFPSSAGVPQVGGAVDYNYQVMKWYMENWYGRTSKGYRWINVHAVNITFGVYVPLFCLYLFKKYYVFSDKAKKTWGYQVYNFISTLATLLCLIISAHEAWKILKYNDTYHGHNLKVVGEVPAGLGIFRSPSFPFPLKKVFLDVIPLTIICFMEAYSVARKTSAARGKLSDLNPSQELFALGLGNLSNAVSSGYPGYPGSGSFSRSSLYSNCGAQTLLAKVVTLVIVLVALGTLTDAFYYIPQAALASVVMVAVLNLIDFHEFWVAWKLSKKDFFVMFVTFIFTFIFDTEVGLCCGFGVSIAVLLKDLAYSLESKPISRAITFKGVEIIRLNGNLVFVSAATIKDTLVNEIFERNKGELKAVVLDFIDVKHADMSGLIAMKEVIEAAKKVDMRVFMVNMSAEVRYVMDKAGVESDDVEALSPDLQESIRAALAVSGNSVHETLDVESLGMVQELLNETRAGTLLELATWSARERMSVNSPTVARPASEKVFEGNGYAIVKTDDEDAEGVELIKRD